ncbi:DegT/DnrJ/EryC1/StrS family aminotransferase [bacterium]|nr:DegT/DnrJ/EryC1/StrS family aminotransferase [candidate division CSSED10-310 bacterium]
MAIPMLDLGTHHQGAAVAIEARVLEVLRSGGYILGKNVRELEARLAEYCGAAHGIGVASGTDALLLAMMALDIGEGDEVITTPYTFFATASAIARTGARPVFVDIEPDTYNIDVSLIEAAVTGNTRAIMPVHLFGQAVDMDALTAVADRHGLAVIEDAAQALSATYRNHPIGGLGTMGCFSFYPSKNLGGAGDGGLVVTSDNALADRLRALRVHGALRTYHHDTIGINSRLDEIQAAILLAKFPHLENWSEQRRENAARYDRLLAHLPVVTPVVRPDRRMIYNQYVVQVGEERNALAEFLKFHEIGHSIYYPVPLHLQPCFSYLGYSCGDFPVAERMSGETIALPIYPELRPEQQEQVVEVIREFFSSL